MSSRVDVQPLLTRVLCRIAPPLAAELAFAQFWALGDRAKVRAADRETHARARRSRLAFGDESVAVYEWGDGPTTVLLVHGWRSRASSLATLVRALESPERTIVSFDAPANGDSTGRRTNAVEYAAVIGLLAERYDGFDVIVGHSLGAFASLYARRAHAVETAGIVTISGVHSFTNVLETFTRMAGLTDRVTAGVRRRIERRTFPGHQNMWREFVAELDPTDAATPVLVIHDAHDPVVPVAEAEAIVDAHAGPSELVITRGLGHARILGDPDVVARVAGFVAGQRPSSAGIRSSSLSAASSAARSSSTAESRSSTAVGSPSQ